MSIEQILKDLDLLKMPGKSKTYSPKWWFDGDLPWYKVKSHLKQTQEDSEWGASSLGK